MQGLTLPRTMGADLFKRDAPDTNIDDNLWSAGWYASQSVSGIYVSQVTALSTPAIFSPIRVLSEDVAKLRWILYNRDAEGKRREVKDHWLARLFKRPNSWQTGFDFRLFLMVQLCLRANAYFVICRRANGKPYKFIPVNSDRVAIWEAPDGNIFYRVTPLGLHERAELIDEPFLIPAEDICHIRGISMNGLLGSALIVLGKEAIALALAYEQQAARWMSAGSKPSGVLATDQKLTKETAERLATDWRDKFSGVQNVGKIAVLEQGLKFQQTMFDAVQLDFLKQRQFQLEEGCRLLRVPPHMVGIAQQGRMSGAVEQQATEYLNFTLSGYTRNFAERLDFCFDIEDGEGLEMGFGYEVLTEADLTTRVATATRAVAGGLWSQNEGREYTGRDRADNDPKENADKLWMPTNVAYAGSQAGGGLPDGGGRPEGSPNKEEIEK